MQGTSQKLSMTSTELILAVLVVTPLACLVGRDFHFP